jgi:DnaJ-class molecular chaperone
MSHEPEVKSEVEGMDSEQPQTICLRCHGLGWEPSHRGYACSLCQGEGYLPVMENQTPVCGVCHGQRYIFHHMTGWMACLWCRYDNGQPARPSQNGLDTPDQ